MVMYSCIHFRGIVWSSVKSTIGDVFRQKNILNGSCILFKQPFSTHQRVIVKPQQQNVIYSLSRLQIGSARKRGYETNAMSTPDYKTKSHSFTWISERVMTICLIGTLPAIAFDTTHVIEGSTCSFVMLHLYWGLEAICVDYLRPSVVGKRIPKLIPVIVGVPLLFTLYGLLHLIVNEKGIFHVVKQFWFLSTTEELLNSDS